METIKIKGQISQADYVKAQFLHLKPRPLFKVTGMIIGSFMFFVGLVNLTNYFAGNLPLQTALFVPGFATLIFGYFIFLRWQFQKSYQNYKAIQVPIEVEINNIGFFGQSTFGESKLPWELFRTYKENKELFLLYQTVNLFHVLPKRLFCDAEQIETAKNIFNESISK